MESQNTIRLPERWHKRDLLTARRFNEVIDTLDALKRRANGPRQVFQTAAPSKTFIWCIVRDVTPLDGKIVTVQLVDGTEGSYSLKDEFLEAFVMPGMFARDYKQFVSSVNPQVEELKILPLVKVNGAWHVWQLMKWLTVKPKPTDVISDAG